MNFWLVFTFNSTSANALNSTNTALGTVVMATNYNVLEANFVNKQQMESYEFSTSGVPSQNMIHPIECAKGKNLFDRLHVRGYGVPALGDQRIYDMGNFQLATVGSQAAADIGELWVSYHIRFHRPVLAQVGGNIGEGVVFGRWYTVPTTTSILAGPIAMVNNPVDAITIAGNVITLAGFSGSQVRLTITARAATTFTCNSGAPNLVGFANVNIYSAGTASGVGLNTGATYFTEYTGVCNANLATLTPQIPSVVTGAASAEIMIQVFGAPIQPESITLTYP